MYFDDAEIVSNTTHTQALTVPEYWTERVWCHPKKWFTSSSNLNETAIFFCEMEIVMLEPENVAKQWLIWNDLSQRFYGNR